jgi:hypothetical protein
MNELILSDAFLLSGPKKLVERGAGVIYPHALVEKTPNGISRKYGRMIAHIGDLQ